ncbi:hypothetical protein ASG19_10010 [Rhizobium sp. Leaf306]|uniref:recombinase family protein n=1 Tax=Rhizobium sp. Leaf306 TaxID=1736330 RepID=UPI0007160F51|nr:recombinase family protein [Rhizobium sp. Leaf306]KQQ36724.1 hypothetical protein ASG19_10010 [Rhizobium sp. Leaf306]
MIKRVALYARYSTDQQNLAPIETQVHLGTAFVEKHGRRLHEVYVDAGVSGASFETRPGLQSMLSEPCQGAFDVLLCLTLDRLSRDLEHSARILKLLHFHEVVELCTVHGGTAERRVSRLSAVEDHVQHEVPELRIVMDELWMRARREQQRRFLRKV